MDLRSPKFRFFRESGWMVVATVLGGAFMYLVHIPASRVPKVEYGIVNALLQFINQMGIPSVGLQMSFVGFAVHAEDGRGKGSLSAAVRLVLRATFCFWLLAAFFCALYQPEITRTYQLTNPWTLWITLLVALTALWNPIFLGILQGRQNFLWLGIATIAGGIGRFAATAIVVFLFAGESTGVMIAVLLGMTAGLLVGVWKTREYWRAPATTFDWRGWLKKIAPLTLGLGAPLYMFSQDMLVVQEFFPKSAPAYGAAGMIGRALLFLTLAMTTVLFPKIVKNAAESRKVLFQALGATALVGGGMATFLTLFPKLPILMIQGKGYLDAAPLIPWFAWCMVPLTLANVLISNLIAREQFGIVPFLVILAAGYGITLQHYHPSPLAVIKTLGAFSTVTLLICALYTGFRKARQGGQRSAT